MSNNTASNFTEWLKGFPFNLRSVYYGKEYRREKVINTIEKKLEDKQRLLLLGESGTSKTILLMEVLCDYLSKGYKILHNLDPTASGEIKNLEYLENTLSLLVKNGNNVVVIVDNVHNKTISTVFSLIQKIKNDYENKLDKIKFLLSARQPEFGWAMDRGIFDSETIERIDILFDDDKRYDIPYFTEDEVKGFIEKYHEFLHPSKRIKSIEENAKEILQDTDGHPIMVRFSVLQDGLRSHVKRMYTDYLVQKDGEYYFPSTERIKSVIACSLYDISSIPLTEDELYNKLDLENPSFQIINTMIKRTGNRWTTIHPRWDLELFKHLFSLNETDRRSIQKAFGFVLNKILKAQRGTYNQLLILNTLYKTIAAEQFINIKFIQEMIKVDDIKKEIDNPFFKVLFFANIIGVVFGEFKDYNYAIICFDKAIDIDPQYATAYYNKGLALSALGRKDDAIDCYDKAIDIDPQYAKAYYNKGVALFDLNINQEAIVCFDKATEVDPQYVIAYINKGNALSELVRNEEAVVCFDKAIEIDPQYAIAYYNKGNSLSELGRNEEAIACYNKAIEIYPQYVSAYQNKGISLFALGRNEEAIVNYDKAIEINPQYTGAYYNKGIALSTLGRNEEAIVCFDKAIEINPQYTNAYLAKGIVLSDLGSNEEAIVWYSKAIDINPQYTGAYYNKGIALSTLGRNEEAIVCFDKAIEINPQYTNAYLAKGIVLSDLGSNEEAIVWYSKAIDIDPQYTGAYYSKGTILSELDRKEEAITWFDKALDIDPNYSDALNDKALALANLDKNEEALSIIEKALKSDSNNEYYLSTAAFIMYNLKRYDEAKLYYNKALDVNPNLKDTLSEPELKAFNSVMEWNNQN